MSLEQEDLERFTSAINGLNDSIKKFNESSYNGNNKAEIHVNAGGFGIWLCASICVILFLMFVGIGFLYIDQGRKLDRLQDTETVVLQYAPQWVRDIVNKKGDIK